MSNKFEIVVLSDNRKQESSDLETEHGLCVFLRTGSTNILLDTGASDLFLRNAQRLGIDLNTIDYVFISHGHADHIGGLESFLNVNRKAKIILSEKALNQRFYSTREGMKEIGKEFHYEAFEERLILVNETTHLPGDICIFRSENNLFFRPMGNRTLFKDAGHGLVLDDFDHELVFCAGRERLFVFTGCGHHGLLNILYDVEHVCGAAPKTVLGGFHLLHCQPDQHFESEEDLEQIGTFITQHYPDTQFYTGHCTGSTAVEQLKNNQIILFHAGFQALL